MGGTFKTVDLVHLGPQKSGTTWLYECLKEHPQIACAPKDSIHYYDMFYHRGPGWYDSRFETAQPHQLRFDTTPSYIRSLRAPERISHDNPKAKLALTLRHPIDRAFSHYWHERKNPNHRFEFNEILTNYDFFASWLETGFYGKHLERYLEHFDRQQLLCQRFDLLQRDPAAFLHQFLVFAGVNSDFTPSVLTTRVNQAKVIRTRIGALRVKAARGIARVLGREFLNTSFARLLTESSEYEKGVDRDLYNTLLEICLPEIELTEEVTKMDLSSWKKFRD